MDGRCQEAVAEFGRKKFGAKYADTITQPGMVGILANGSTDAFLAELKKEIDISITRHNSKGIIVDGHEECAGDPVDNATHKDHIRKTIAKVIILVNGRAPVVGTFVRRSPQDPNKWEAEELPFSSPQL